MIKTFVLIIQINNTTPAMIAEYVQQGDCEEVAYILSEAMPNGDAWCEGDLG